MDEAKKQYLKRLYGPALIVLGGYFLIEHVSKFGFEWNDFLGHEWLGIYLIIGGAVLGAWSNGFKKK